jgi:N-acetylglucosaminyldiphosphoundecaprenol N-acetyl-beta-D-mannosaminyltransferase
VHMYETAKVSFMGVEMHSLTTAQTIKAIDDRIKSGVVTVNNGLNVAKFVQVTKDIELSNFIKASDIISIEGIGLVWGLRLLGYDVPERVAGIDLFAQLLELANRRNLSVFLLGSKPETVEMAVNNLKESHPQLHIAGYHHGYFWDREDEIVEMIRLSKAHMLFVGITSPFQERFIYKWKNELGVKFAMGVGGSLDVMAGKTKRAPLIIQNIGFEWLYRLVQEPRRLCWRYLYSNSIFMLYIIKSITCSLIGNRCKLND